MWPPIRVTATSTCGFATIQLGWEWTRRWGVAGSAERIDGRVKSSSQGVRRTGAVFMEGGVSPP